MTQACLEELLGDITELCTYMVTKLGEVTTLLKEANVSMEAIGRVSKLFDDKSPFCKPFHNLETNYLQLAYYRSHFGFVVSFSNILVHSDVH